MDEIKLTKEEAQQIINQLSEMPFKSVANIIGFLNSKLIKPIENESKD